MSKAAVILFIEDDESGRELSEYNLRNAGYEVEAVASGAAGLASFDPARHDVVITDVRMPGVSGMEVLAEIHGRAPETPVIVITAYGNVELAVDAMKAGAFDFIGKPFNRDHLLLTVARALETRRLRAEVDTLRIKAAGVEREIVCRSPGMRALLEMADRAAPSAAPVLITGEYGTGKELIARRLHVRGSSARGPFVAVHCSAMGPEAAERALFGRGGVGSHDRSALGRARGGTLFVDEVTALDDEAQRRLLRVLEEGVFEAPGGSEVSTEVRVIASTRLELDEAVASNELREDLRYRLEVVHLQVPPLRDRKEDVEPLVRHFVRQLEPQREGQVSQEHVAAFMARPWPGNVRELENAVERLLLVSPDGELTFEGLTPGVTDDDAHPFSSWPPLPEDGLSLVDLERRVIERVLRLKNGNVSQAAAYLQVPRHVLAYRMEKYGIQRKG